MSLQGIKIAFVKEPVEEFLNWKGFEPLALTEQDPVGSSKMVQIHIIRTLYHFYRDHLSRYKDYDLIICDRYLTSVRFFSYNLLHMGYITQFDLEVILAVLEDYETLLPRADHSVYLRRSSTWCLEMIARRARVGELQTCDVPYITGLVAQYERFFSEQSGVLEITHQNREDISRILIQFIESNVLDRPLI